MSAVKEYRCPNCGAGVGFDPILQHWKCSFCNSEFNKNQLKTASDIKDNLDEPVEDLNLYHCSSCGAELIADDTTSATFCLYCRNHSVIKSRFSGRFKPEKLITFRITKEQAKDIYKKWIKKKIFAPSIFKNKEEIDKITGVYAPYWLFDCITNGYIEGQATRVRTWTSGNYKYTNTKYYRVVRGGNSKYSKVPVDGSNKLDDNIMNLIEPYNYNAITDFSMEYMSGFFAEKYDVEAHEAEMSMRKKVEKFIEDRLRSTVVGYSTFNITQKSINISDCAHKYAMMPVYLINNKYKEKNHIFIINGQTGKIAGETPISLLRQIGFGIGLALIIWLSIGFGGALFV
ncbi:MAG: zinc ribbon domain-containing protein [Epulopiscium sp.]|nr:zinc ribbon domain-containing protein [Candidatus Epulonipiscium sp.]